MSNPQSAQYQIGIGMIAGLLVSLLLYLAENHWASWYQSAISILTVKLLLSLFLPSLACNLVLIYFVVKSWRKSRTENVAAFGILWDRDKNSYCPSCEIPMSDYDRYIPYSEEKCFLCASCKGTFKLRDKLGNPINLADCMDSIKATSE